VLETECRGPRIHLLEVRRCVESTHTDRGSEPVCHGMQDNQRGMRLSPQRIHRAVCKSERANHRLFARMVTYSPRAVCRVDTHGPWLQTARVIRRGNGHEMRSSPHRAHRAVRKSEWVNYRLFTRMLTCRPDQCVESTHCRCFFVRRRLRGAIQGAPIGGRVKTRHELISRAAHIVRCAGPWSMAQMLICRPRCVSSRHTVVGFPQRWLQAIVIWDMPHRWRAQFVKKRIRPKRLAPPMREKQSARADVTGAGRHGCNQHSQRVHCIERAGVSIRHTAEISRLSVDSNKGYLLASGRRGGLRSSG
jgi:hypothetical protein